MNAFNVRLSNVIIRLLYHKKAVLRRTASLNREPWRLRCLTRHSKVSLTYLIAKLFRTILLTRVRKTFTIIKKEFYMTYWQIFLFVAIVAFVLEMFTPAMFFLSIAVAALITAIAALWYTDIHGLIITCSVLSVLILLVIRPMMKKFMR